MSSTPPPAARARILRLIDGGLARLGLVRMRRVRPMAEAYSQMMADLGLKPAAPQRLLRMRAAQFGEVTGRTANAMRRMRAQRGEYRWGYGTLMNALNLWSGAPDQIPPAKRSASTSLGKVVIKAIGERAIRPRAGITEPIAVSLLDTIRSSVRNSTVIDAVGLPVDIEQAADVVRHLGTGISFLRLKNFDAAWEHLSALGRDRALELAPVEYLDAAAHGDPAEAEAAAAVLVNDPGTAQATLDAERWLEVAEHIEMLGRTDLAALALDRSEALDPTGKYDDRRAFARDWIEIAEADHTPAEGAISIGMIDYKQPGYRWSSMNLGDHVQTVAALGHLVRHKNLTFEGDAEVVELADELASRVRPDREITDSAAARVNLIRVQRDASDLQNIPDKTWMVTFGWYAHPRPDDSYGMPLHANIRPIFVSVHVARLAMLTPEAIAYLKKYSPVGCRDWHTVHLLNAAGIPAFFSGCMTTTVDTLFPGEIGPRGGGELYVDVKGVTEGLVWRQMDVKYRNAPFVDNIRAAVEKLQSYRDYYDAVHTSRLHSYLPSRSIGVNVHFHAKLAADARFDGLIGIDDEAFDTMRTGIRNKLEQVMRLIVAREDEDAVYAKWREITADDVAFANAKREAAISTPVPNPVDIPKAVAAARAEMRTTLRTVPVEGDEIDLELSLDGNFKLQMLTMVQAILRHTKRPVHFWVLARDHSPADFEVAERLFPQASFTWIPCDHIDYGDTRLIKHTSVATMDRLLLPALLPELKKIVHLDLDAIAVGDVGLLYDTDVTDVPLAARTAQEDILRSGFDTFRASANAMTPELAREYIVRTHARHAFGFKSFNAGVLVFNLERMRADGFEENYFGYAPRFGLHDQDVLNVYAASDRATFGSEWNRIARDESIEGAKFIHWAGHAKPWGTLPVRGKALWTDERDELLGKLSKAEVLGVRPKKKD
jgi:lipopolysaccharide biosynthesis glycosyltransferase